MSKKDDKELPGAAAPSPGDDLLDQVIRMTGIPSRIIRDELAAILEKKNIKVETLTLEQLRQVVASYLREIMASILERRSDSRH